MKNVSRLHYRLHHHVKISDFDATVQCICMLVLSCQFVISLNPFMNLVCTFDNINALTLIKP
jgi:hypothetical protein